METSGNYAKLLAQLVAMVGLVMSAGVDAAAQDSPVQLASDETTVNRNISQTVEQVEMLVQSSRILTLEGRIPKFQVHNETLLGASPVAQNQIQIFAKAPGTTQLNLWDSEDKLYTVNVTISPDAREVEGILATQLPLAALRVLPVNTSAIISGTVTNVEDVDRAVAIVEQFYANVVNNIRVVGVQQILLHTRIMEVSRTKLRELGIDWGFVSGNSAFTSNPGGLVDVPGSTIASALTDGVLPSAAAVDATNGLLLGGNEFTALVSALRQQDLVKFLAEPTVVATHGRPARFNVGGRVPTIVPSTNGAVQIQYEEFGTAIDFLPFIVGSGRVRLEVRPEVSEVDASLGVFTQGVLVNGFRTRYVETAVELQAGQTFAIAGLLSSRTESQTRSTPLLGELPYIGSLFRTVREERNEIELLITVTPELVAALDPHEAPRGGPGLNSAHPTDKDLYFRGHIEVPNLLGDSGCSVEGNSHGCSDGGCAVGGHSVHHSAPVHSSGSGHYGVANQGSSTRGGFEYSGTVLNPPGVPVDAIVPGNQPVSVGGGVSISAPEYPGS